jgi:Protein of unknown function (DUF3015)
MKRMVLVGVAIAAILAGGLGREARASDCAVGGFVVNKKTGIIEQLLAFTTNGTFFVTYAGAITTGTSGCSNSGIVKQDYEQRVFVTANFDALSQDLARGQGENVNALSSLMGCPTSLTGEVASVAQAHFGELVTGGPDRTMALLVSLKNEMRVHPALSASCTRLA